jgi:hypothetical protein
MSRNQQYAMVLPVMCGNELPADCGTGRQQCAHALVVQMIGRRFHRVPGVHGRYRHAA